MLKRFCKMNQKAEKTLAYGGVDLLRSPKLLNAVVLVAIITDFTCFLSSFTSQLAQDLPTCLILALSCAVIIDTVPLVTSDSILKILSEYSTKREKQAGWTTLLLSTFTFLSFFIFTAIVRFHSGDAMFNGGALSYTAMQTPTAESSLTAAQTGLVVLTCFLPLFTSVSVLLLGLFSDTKAKRRYVLRKQADHLTQLRTQLEMQCHELQAVSMEELENTDLQSYHQMKSYLEDISVTMQCYVRLRLAEHLQATPDDLNTLSARSLQIAQMEDQFKKLVDRPYSTTQAA